MTLFDGLAVVLVMVGLKLPSSDKLLQPEQGVLKNMDGATLFKRVQHVYKNNIKLRQLRRFIFFVLRRQEQPQRRLETRYVTIRGIPDESSTNCIANVLKIYIFRKMPCVPHERKSIKEVLHSN